MDLQIIFPATDDGALSTFLRAITQAISEATGEEGGYGLGGSHGYGMEWNSDVFMMHPYCWCESQTCPWCMGCDCSDPCNLHSKDAFQDVGFEPDHGAPNFWHKPSGLKVWWYKYIGRGMEVMGEADLNQIGRECLIDIARGMETRQGGNAVPSRSDDSPVGETDAPNA